jgi:hypothetical protein
MAGGARRRRTRGAKSDCRHDEFGDRRSMTDATGQRRVLCSTAKNRLEQELGHEHGHRVEQELGLGHGHSERCNPVCRNIYFWSISFGSAVSINFTSLVINSSLSTLLLDFFVTSRCWNTKTSSEDGYS